MIRIKYGPNQQGIREVEIQPQIIDNLSKIVKESKKKLEPRKKAAPKKNEKQKQKKTLVNNTDIHTPPKEGKAAWQTKGVPKATALKKEKWVWMPKEVKPPTTTSPRMDSPSRSKN